jgi:type IX secretion system PorP/SprF family membrane protein
MRKFLFTLLFVFLSVCGVFAQEKPQYSQYIFNNYLLNPALSGTENYMDVKIGRRLQWAGIKQAPQTTFVSAQWSLGKEYLWSNALSLPVDDDNPMSKSYMQYYTSSPAHHGMGIMAVSDRAGALSRLDAGLSYAYHLQLNNSYNLSVGVYTGLSKLTLDVSGLSLEQTNDPALANVVSTQFKPDLSIGTWFYGAHLFAGFSMQQVLPQKLSFSNSANMASTFNTTFLLTSGYRFYVDEDIAAIPSIMFRKSLTSPFSFDTNLMLSYKDKVWLGTSYRKSDSFSGLVGFSLMRLVNLTYAYDFTVSDLKAVSGGTHEIVLGFQLGGKYHLFSGGRSWN